MGEIHDGDLRVIVYFFYLRLSSTKENHGWGKYTMGT